jgi:DNA modification methylase
MVSPKIEIIRTDKLIPYARNARTHSDEQVSQIAGSIKEFGFTNPVLIDSDNGIIAGHGRVMAARVLGLAEVPCLRLAHLSETQRRAYILADNRIALNSGWDESMLALEIMDLQTEDFDIESLGFDSEEIRKLIAEAENLPTEGLTDPEDIPAEIETPISKLGDIWILGNHRLACGDCTDAHTVEAVMAGTNPHLMVTDPPYGVNYEPGWRDEKLADNRKRALGIVENDNQANWQDAWALFTGNVAYVWHSQGPLQAAVLASLEACDFVARNHIIWVKNKFVIGRGDYHIQHEPCWYAVRKGATGHYNGDRTQSTVWQIPKSQKNETGHSTQKPIECMKRPIENNSKIGEYVYDPFSGSGTTIVAAEMTGRKCIAIEINPAYVDMTIKRWQDFTGKVATLENSGETFTELLNTQIGKE